jgi:copper(I)-binding protein
MERLRALGLATLIALAARPVIAQEFKSGDITIDRPWSRETPKGAQVAAGYLVIHNIGATPDKLIGGAADFAGKIEIHQMSMDHGIMRMRALTSGLEIPAHGEVKLAPKNYHIMFTNLKQPLKKGDSVKVTLTFEHAGSIPVVFEVGSVGETDPAGGDKGGSMKGMKM